MRPVLIRCYVQGIMKSCRRIADIVQDLNAYSRRSRGQEQCDVNLNHTLDEAVKMARRATVVDEIKVVTQYGDVPPVRGNADELLQVFVNLVTNAVQAMEGPGTLTLSTSSANGLVC